MSSEQVEGFRLSPQQKHIWLQQDSDSQAAYRVQGTLKIAGNIDQEILGQALTFVVQRYEILNTTFHLLPGLTVPVQVINEPNGTVYNEHDLANLDSDEQAARATALLDNARKATPEWEGGPLLHIEKVQLAPELMLLHLSLPAMCADAVSLANLTQEISQAYSAILDGGAVEAEEPLQFADVAEWQNEILASEDGEKETEFWYRKMLAAPAASMMPFEKQVNADAVFAPRSVSRFLQSNVVAKIDEIVAGNKVSPAAFFLACWQILLHRHTGQSELMFGVGCDGRTADELVDAVGPLTKYLPQPGLLHEDIPFPDVLASVEKSLAEALDRQEFFCWEQFGTTADSDLAIGYFPLSFDYVEQAATQQQGDISFSVENHQYVCLERFHLKLQCERREDGLSMEFYYDSSRFENKAIERLSEQFNQLLTSILASPAAAIGSFNVLSESERTQLLVSFNESKHDFPDGRLIHEMIEEQAEKYPDNLAVIFADQEISYSELDRRANQMANHLHKLGIGPDVMVGLFMEPSIEIMVGLLGILKAGGAYVPIDPEYPQERLDFIMEDTQAPVLLTQKRLVGDTRAHTAKIICLDTEWDSISGESEARPTNEMTAENLAYVIYTSGSTGKPKGVLVTHRNLVHSTYARVLYYPEPVGRYLLLSSFSFDSSVAGIFWTLIQAGALVLPAAGTQRDPGSISNLIATNKVTHTLCLASHYALIMTETDKQKMASLKTNIVSGEVFSMALVNRHDELAPQSKLYNEYGPTEASVWCIVFDCHDPFSGNQVPIGKPIANTQIYVLNSHMQPAPIGAPGEIYIGGVGVTNGYLNRAELTEERFVPAPFSSDPNAKLYRSGDAARFLADGNIEFLGRDDDQVKIRGYRIELGEIEAVLGQHPNIREVVVLAREDTPGEKRLVAYLATKQKEAPTVGSLREYLSERMPDYMVPTAFVFMAELPRTPIGKLDRKALPVPTKARPNLESVFVAARTPVEEILTGISAEVLGIDEVGVDDNFFELGGHSIIITQLAARVRDTLAVEVPLRTIFEAPTVFGLTEAIFQHSADREKVEKTAELALKVAQMSEDDAEAMLTQ